MTKLFVPIAVHKHRYYSLSIHTTFNLLQYILLQSMIIFLHVSDFFPWLPKHLTSSSRLQKRYYGSVCVNLLFPRKYNRITQVVKWIQGPTINVLFPYYSVKLHLFYPFNNFWKGKLTEIHIGRLSNLNCSALLYPSVRGYNDSFIYGKQPFYHYKYTVNILVILLLMARNLLNWKGSYVYF